MEDRDRSYMKMVGMLASRLLDSPLFFRFGSTMLFYALICTWLLPWSESGIWTEAYHPTVVLVFIGLLLFSHCFTRDWRWQMLASLLICSITLPYLHRADVDESRILWLIGLPWRLVTNAGEVWHYGLLVISQEWQSMLLLVGWAMLLPALQSLIWNRQLGLGLSGGTIIYLIALSFWLNLPVFWHIVVAVICGFLLASLVAIPRYTRIEAEKKAAVAMRLNEKDMIPKIAVGEHTGAGAGWLVPAMITVLLIGGTALAINYQQEQRMSAHQASAGWSTAAYQQLERFLFSVGGDGWKEASLSDNSSSGFKPVAKTGYSSSDLELGAPLKADYRLLFYGLSPIRHYWRGESKQYYDGRGWRSTTNEFVPRTIGASEAKPATSEVEADRLIEQKIIWAEDTASSFLVASGQSAVILSWETTTDEAIYLSNERDGAIAVAKGAAPVSAYVVQSLLPPSEEEIARRSLQTLLQESDESGAARALPADENDLQLPSSLPNRVRALAAEIAGGGVTSRYDQVKSVEHYLQTSYSYSLENSTMPPAGEDFVDHFLFEQQQGYCVHFSTAMVVLLRSLDIPARWVKGFAPGEVMNSSSMSGERAGEGGLDERQIRYAVRASDAHAWVEVYFDGIGWAPFDPTPGYSLAGAATEVSATLNDHSDRLQPRGWAALPKLSLDQALDLLWFVLLPLLLLMLVGYACVVRGERLTEGYLMLRYTAIYSYFSRLEQRNSGAGSNAGMRRRAVTGKHDRQLRSGYLSVATCVARSLIRRHAYKQSMPVTARQLFTELSEQLKPEQRNALEQLVQWQEAAEYDYTDRWRSAPTPRELKLLLAQVR